MPGAGAALGPPGAAAVAIRVLLIDDHDFFRTCLSALLESCGFEVVASCPSVHDGLQRISETGPHVVLIDLDLPEVDGVRGTELILARWPQLPVLMLTGAASGPRHRAALAAGVRRVLTKDDPADLLVSSIHEALGHRPARTA
jgi:two-component system, NarL family, response regulator LiaR